MNNPASLDFKKFLGEAQAMQQKVQRAHEELGDIEVQGEAGDQNISVQVTLNGRHELVNLTLEISAQYLISLMREKGILLDTLSAKSVTQQLQEEAELHLKEALKKGLQEVVGASQRKLSDLVSSIQPDLSALKQINQGDETE